jgi:hypothetical protein
MTAPPMWESGRSPDREELSIVRRDEHHLYAIQPDQGYFDAGMTGDGGQALMGLYCPDLISIRFDTEGNLLGFGRRRREHLRPIEAIYPTHDEVFRPELRAWQEEIGFRPVTIRVKRFSIPELGIGIQDDPDHFQEILADPDYSEEEKADIRESIAVWEADGQFVLLWGTTTGSTARARSVHRDRSGGGRLTTVIGHRGHLLDPRLFRRPAPPG